MKRALWACAGIGLLFLSGCAEQPAGFKIDYLKGKGMYPPQPYVQVLDHEPMLWKYVPIARIRLNGTSDLTNAQELTALEQKARSLGANAVIVSHEEQTEQPELQYSPAGGQYSTALPKEETKFSVLAIHISKRVQ